MIIYANLDQGTPEWKGCRLGKLTASNAQAIASAGAGLTTYCYEIIAEKYSNALKETYTNEHIDRGNTLEPDARTLYELTTNQTVEQVGFVEMNEYVGCSPDGLVGAKGLTEFKCPSDVKYMKLLLNGESEIDSAYIWQMQMQLFICEREWCDFVAYNPNFEKALVIYRIYPDKENFEKLKKGFEKGIETLKKFENILLTNK